MTSDERELKNLVDRHLPSPSHMEFVATRDRVLDQLRAAPPHLQKARVADPPHAASWLRTVVPLAAAAALIATVATVSFQRGDWIATVEAADGSTYTLKPDTVLSAKDPRGLRLTLKDGSTIEMRSASKLSLAPVANGVGIRLLAGDIIVNAADQTGSDLSVHTSDMTIAVAGTTSLVKTVEDGSRVAAIAGTVRVNENGFETVLHPGEQFTTSPTLATRPLRDDVFWSRNAVSHLAILDAFTKGIAQTRGSLTPLARQVDAPGAQTPTPAAVNAQSAGPEFEEASIRECDPDNLPPSLIGARGGGANSVMATPGRWYGLCLTPATLIRTAYGYRPVNVEALLPDALPRRGGRAPIRGQFGVVGSLGMEDGLRVRGGPDWVRRQQFTIEAVANGTPDPATMAGPMLRALLERRFKLKTHVETEQTLAYNLVVAPGGLKIKPVPAGSCEVPPAAGAPQVVARRRDGTLVTGALVNGMPLPTPHPLAELRRAARPSCAELQGPNGPNWVMLAGEATFGDLTRALRELLGRAVRGIGVTDKTGITDKFNWDLEYLPDAIAGPGSTIGIIPDADAKVARAPTIFEALEQQLGLRLEATKVPREYLVIDSIERPGPN
jgi:uncharacterized protein (TIGR03435 family)